MSIDKKKLFRTALLGSAATAATGIAFGAGSIAFAQDADTDAAEEQVLVTGSRIPRQDLIANSPVAIIGAEEITLTGQVQVEELLNDLPQVVPGLTSVNNNPTGARPSLDLRGMGPNRTLVLVNGRRWLPSSLAGQVDTNTIPAGMIERIEIVTGGASATYGSDAIAGVVNFILKDDFEGLTANAQYSIYGKGDGEKIYVDATMGANFADGRGNVMINVSWFKQNPVFQGDRAFSAVACTSWTTDPAGTPTVPFGPFGAASPCGAWDPFGVFGPGGTNQFIAIGSSRVPQGRIDGISGILVGAEGGTSSIVFNNNGTTAHRFFGPIGLQILGPITSIDLYNYAPPNYLQLPITRTTMNMTGHYDINDDIEFFMDASFVNTDVATRLAPTPATTTVNLHTSNPFLQGITIGDTGLNLVDVLVESACRNLSRIPNAGTCIASTTTTFTNNGSPATIGTATATFVNINPFTGAAALSWLQNNENGNMQFSVRRRMVEVGAREAPNDMDTYQFTVGFRGEFSNGWSWDMYYQYAKWRRQFSVRNDVNSIRFKQAIDVRLSFDSNGNPIPGSTACAPIAPAQELLATATAGACVPLNIFGLNSITPDMVKYIRLDATQETEFEREMFGFNLAGTIVELPAGPLGFAVGVEARRESGRFSPDDVFSNGLSLGFNAVQPTRGRVNVWEAFAETLIPLIADKTMFKYLAVEAGLRWSKYSTVGTIFTWKLGGEWRPFNDLKIRGLFQKAVRAPNISELFGGIGQGFPSFADPCNGTFSTTTATGIACIAWGVPTSLVTGGFTQTDSQVQAAFSSNPNLIEETANTWTVGGVFTPQQIPNLEMSIDYYSISLSNAVSLAFGGTRGTIAACLAAGGQSTSIPCQRTPRDAQGQLGTLLLPVIVSLVNVDEFGSRGLDVAVRYNFDLESAIGVPGTIDIDALYTHTFSGPGGVGTFNFFPGAIIPKDKVSARFTYRKGAYTVSLRWTMIGSLTNGFGTGYLPAAISAEHVLDFTFQWQVNDTVGLTVGVENVLNNKPPFLAGFGVEGNTDPSTFNAQVLGPRLFGRVTANF
ncbi:MAG: TonB-dependent receptor [Proteobacteria bacterium]|nr:TonB-dependent receptor [Pseudomonadota bacterium]